MRRTEPDTPLCYNNIRLRAVEPEDADLLYDVESDSSQWKANGMMAPLSRHLLLQYALSYTASPEKEGQLRLIAEASENDIPFVVGVVDIFEIDTVNGNASVAIYIIPKYRNSGYGTLCLEIISRYCLHILNLNVIIARISEVNPASRRMFEKASFVMSGSIPEFFRDEDGNHSLLIMYRLL